MSASTTQPRTTGTPSTAAGTTAATGGSYQSTSLYVGDLMPDVSEGHLFEIFNKVGPVASIRVCRDAVTRRSLGYAYVNFHSPQDAERALDTMNNAPIKDQPCRIMWSQRDPSIRKSGVGNIFIKNLDKNIEHKALYDTFSDFGNILSCKVAVDENGNSKGYGFVHYETQEMADRAIEKVNGMLLGEKKVFVGPFIPKKERMQNRFKNFTNVYVKNIPEDVTDDEFKAKFEEVGPVTSCVIMKDNEGKSKGFGFVNFEKHEDAAKGVEELNDYEWEGKTNAEGKKLFVSRAQKKAERHAELRMKFTKLRNDFAAQYQGVNLYIKNLDDEFGDEWLKKEFSPFGTITSARAMRDDKGNHKGFGFVCFTTPEEATKAVTEMHGRVYGSKPIYVALAQPREVRRAHLEAQYAQRQKGPGRAYPAGMPNAAMYAAGTPPVYYPPQGVPPQQFVYPQQLAASNMGPQRWQGHPQQGYPQQQMPGSGYPPVRGGHRGRGGRYPQRGGRGGSAQNAPSGANAAPAAEQNQAITLEYLHKVSPEDQFLFVSQHLYPIIQQQQPKLAPKITGMLRSWYLENNQGPEELLRLMQSPEALNAKIQEAVDVWQKHLAGQESSPNSEQSQEQKPSAEQNSTD